VPSVVPLSVVQKVLQALLSERIAIRNLPTIMEATADFYHSTKEPEILAEYVRMALKRQITNMYRDQNGRITVFTIDPAIEQVLTDSVQNTKQGLMFITDPAFSEKLVKRVGKAMSKLSLAGLTPICLCSPNIRLALKRLTEAAHPQLVVLSYNEITNDVEILSNDVVRLEDDH